MVWDHFVYNALETITSDQVKYQISVIQTIFISSNRIALDLRYLFLAAPFIFIR